MAVGVASYLQPGRVRARRGRHPHDHARGRGARRRSRGLPGRHASTGTRTARRMRDPATFERGSREPFPEQFNTRVSDAATGYHAAPVELDRDFLLDEGFPADTIEVVGNTVVDATVAARADAARATVFETYPQLESGAFIRICIHRRENTDRRAPLPGAVRRDGEARTRRPLGAVHPAVRHRDRDRPLRAAAPRLRRCRRSTPTRSSTRSSGRTTATSSRRCRVCAWSPPTPAACRRR